MESLSLREVTDCDLPAADARDPVMNIGACTAACALYRLNVCAAIREKTRTLGLDSRVQALDAIVQHVPARRTICRPTEWSDYVSSICSGWASSSIVLPDGRRQILSFLLPGDFISIMSLFEPTTGRLVEAVTDVTYRNHKRSDLQAVVMRHGDLFEMVTKACFQEKHQADQLAVDLGRRTADERIARLILNLKEKLATRGMAQGETIEFPLRHHHIADATGLTPVHVSKVLSQFRRDRLIEISNRSLTILKPAEFSRIANMW